MRTLCAATLLFTFSSFAPAQQSSDLDHYLRASWISSLLVQPADRPAVNAPLATVFDPVPISSIPDNPVATPCAAPIASATLPPPPVTKLSTAGSRELPNSDAPPVAYTRLPITPEPRVDSRKRFFISNTIMYGATVFHAFGRQAEIDACKRESGFANGVYLRGSYKGMTPATLARFYAIALPIDAGVTLVSALARGKGWRSFEILAPFSAASAHITAGAFKFSSGCY